MNHQGLRNYDSVAVRVRRAAQAGEWEPLVVVEARGRTYPVFRLKMGHGNRKRALLSAGIHGDEPAGVETLLTALESGFFDRFCSEWEITLVPCINPTGFETGTRENHAGIDLNRQFKEPGPVPEVVAIQSLFAVPYDLDLELHEDVDTPGYYLYQKENGGNSPLGRNILDAVSDVMPLNVEPEIEDLPADRGLITRLSNPDEMEWWPMALYAYQKACTAVFTLETSIQFPMETRVRAHLQALEAALSGFEATRFRP